MAGTAPAAPVSAPVASKAATVTNHVSPVVYLQYAAAGGLCCCVTHVAVVPIDVIKTRMQTNPGKYLGMWSGMRTLAREEGAGILLQGLGPTAAGYTAQGALKFGFYEYFKKLLARTLGPEQMEAHRVGVWLTAAAAAEFIGDLALCPMEAARIRLVAQPDFARGLFDSTLRLFRQEGMSGLYKGLPAIVAKQVPYTMTKFAVFEAATDALLHWLHRRRSRALQQQDDAAARAVPAVTGATPHPYLSPGDRLAVSLGAGLVAGITGSAASQPGDTLLSKVNQARSEGEPLLRSMVRLARQLGVRGLFTGFVPRSIMVTSIIAGQFLIYDSAKLLFGLHA